MKAPASTSRQLFFYGGALLAFTVAPFVSRAQSIHLAPVTGVPGGKIVIEISLKSPEGQHPSTLQWQTTIPLAKVGPLEEITLGPDVDSRSKSVNCAVKSKTAENYTTVCILAGGQQPIRNGVVAILRLTLAPAVEPGSFRIRMDEGLAIYKDLKRVNLKPAETVVTIRPR